MWCSLCRRNKCRSRRAPAGMATWVEVPCKVITRQSLTEHSQSNCHKEAMSVETTRALAQRQGGIAEAFYTVVSLQKKAFVGHDFFWLVKLDYNTKLFALGSDGASVMLGRRGGVSKLLMDHVPYLISNHCIAHRLALACGQAANDVPLP